MWQDSSVSRYCQLLASQFKCAGFLRYKVVCGALTNGHDWMFLIVKLNDGYDGASYKRSDKIHLKALPSLDFQEVPSSWVPSPDLIPAILLHWVSSFSTVIELLTEGNVR